VKLALHRSITFWSGILVMGFTGLMWVDSTTRATGAGHNDWYLVSYRAGVHYSSAGADAGEWRFQYRRPIDADDLPVKSYWPPVPYLLRKSGPAQQMDYWGDQSFATMRDFDEYYLQGLRPGSFICFIPYWLLLLVLASGWAALLFWRARRRHKAWLLSGQPG